jgi:MscS family membrane protein
VDTLGEFLNSTLGLPAWVASLVVIALATTVVNLVAQFALRQAARAAKHTSNNWDDALITSASVPLLVALWVIGLGLMARVVQARVDEQFLEQAIALQEILLLLCGAWFGLRFVSRVQHNIIEQGMAHPDGLDRTTVDALGKLARLLLVVVTLLVIAQTVGMEITGLLALGGVGGLAVGLAAKDILANFFGGLTIYLDRPFSVGEWIRSPDRDIEGTVEYISWRHTRIRGFNKNPIYVPNAVFTTIVVENPGRMSHRRIKEVIGLRYDDFAVVGPICDDIRTMLREHEGIDANQTLIVNFDVFGAASLDLMVYTFTKTVVWVEYHQVKHDVLLKIGQIIEKHGAEIAFPTQTLHVASVPETASSEPRAGNGESEAAKGD